MNKGHRILHVVNSFDPAGDVIRCVNELQRYSRHQHELIVKDPHPGQDVYAYQEAALMGWNVAPAPANTALPSRPPNLRGAELARWNKERQQQIQAARKAAKQSPSPLVDGLMQWADAVLFHFVGHEDGWAAPAGKPIAFRNINIYYDGTKDAFHAAPEYHAKSLDGYKLTASSHVGARDFMPGDNFRWLPDLIPIHAPLYTPDWSRRPPCVSYIKHSPVFKEQKFRGAAHQNLDGVPHPQVLWRRKTAATAAVDNVCDGHYGLSGLELAALGIPTVVFNHEKTRAALREFASLYPPFTEVGCSLAQAIAAVEQLLGLGEHEYLKLRQELRDWMEHHYHSRRVIELTWDKFFDELGG